MTETQLYRHFNADGELLYVGISMTVLIRTRSHSYNSTWFNEVRRIEIEPFPSLVSALEAERSAIRDEKPKHNAQCLDSKKFQNKRDAMRAGRDRAKANGVKLGRKPLATMEKIEEVRQLLRSGMTVQQAGKVVGLKPSTIYLHVPGGAAALKAEDEIDLPGDDSDNPT